MFSIRLTRTSLAGGTQNGGDLYYLTVSRKEIAITLPYIGEVFVKRQTLRDAIKLIDVEVAKYFKLFLQVKLGVSSAHLESLIAVASLCPKPSYYL